MVVCVKWGTKYDAAYVNRLAAGVDRYTYLGHKKAGRGGGGVNHTYEVVCVTDDPEGIEIGPHLVSRVVLLPPDLPLQGWWVKAYLFSPTFPIARGEHGPNSLPSPSS